MPTPVNHWPRVYEAYLFDLDGTLIDTAPDIGAALNYCLNRVGLGPVADALIRHWVGHGSRTLINEALAYHKTEHDIEPMVADFIDHYQAHIADQSQPYPTVVETLNALQLQGKSLAVVTNKLEELAKPLLDALDMSRYFDLVVGGNTAAQPKPHAAPIEWCLERFALSPGDTLMVGDSITDVRGARAANVDVVCVRDGYNQGQPVADFEPDGIIVEMGELLAPMSSQRPPDTSA